MHRTCNVILHVQQEHTLRQTCLMYLMGDPCATMHNVPSHLRTKWGEQYYYYYYYYCYYYCCYYYYY